MSAHPRNREVDIQQRQTTQDETYGTTVEGGWNAVVTVWAEVQDILPSRGDKIADGVNITNRPARIRMLFRDGLNSAMRFIVKGRGPDEPDRTMRIIAGPAEIKGFRNEVEFLAEELTTAGEEP